MELMDALGKVGLTKHESALYIALCREGELSGYEAAKKSGISRSNAYLALAGLVEKGGAYKSESDPVKYIAVSAREFAGNIRRQSEEALRFIEENAPRRDEPATPFITISGKNHIVHKMKNIINDATERIYLSGSPAELRLVGEEIAAARDRGLKVVVIGGSDFLLKGITLYHHHRAKEPGQIRLIADSTYVLTGEIAKSCLYSRNQNLIQLIKDSLINEIKLIQMDATSDAAPARKHNERFGDHE